MIPAALLTPELISLAFGSLTGFIFKYMAERAKEKDEQFKRMLSVIKASDDSADRAANRDGEAGKWVRRFIVICVMFGVIMAPFLLALINTPIVVQVEDKSPEYLWGLIGGSAKTKFVELQGYLMVTEVRTIMTAIIGYYFGSAAASKNTA